MGQEVGGGGGVICHRLTHLGTDPHQGTLTYLGKDATKLIISHFEGLKYT